MYLLMEVTSDPTDRINFNPRGKAGRLLNATHQNTLCCLGVMVYEGKIFKKFHIFLHRTLRRGPIDPRVILEESWKMSFTQCYIKSTRLCAYREEDFPSVSYTTQYK